MSPSISWIRATFSGATPLSCAEGDDDRGGSSGIQGRQAQRGHGTGSGAGSARASGRIMRERQDQRARCIVVSFAALHRDPYLRDPETGAYAADAPEDSGTWGPVLRAVADRGSDLFGRVSIWYYFCHSAERGGRRREGRTALDELLKVAPLPFPVLLRGERGVGKSTLAGIIRAGSRFRRRDLVRHPGSTRSGASAACRSARARSTRVCGDPEFPRACSALTTARHEAYSRFTLRGLLRGDIVAVGGGRSDWRQVPTAASQPRGRLGSPFAGRGECAAVGCGRERRIEMATAILHVAPRTPRAPSAWPQQTTSRMSQRSSTRAGA